MHRRNCGAPAFSEDWKPSWEHVAHRTCGASSSRAEECVSSSAPHCLPRRRGSTCWGRSRVTRQGAVPPLSCPLSWAWLPATQASGENATQWQCLGPQWFSGNQRIPNLKFERELVNITVFQFLSPRLSSSLPLLLFKHSRTNNFKKIFNFSLKSLSLKTFI